MTPWYLKAKFIMIKKKQQKLVSPFSNRMHLSRNQRSASHKRLNGVNSTGRFSSLLPAALMAINASALYRFLQIEKRHLLLPDWNTLHFGVIVPERTVQFRCVF